MLGTGSLAIPSLTGSIGYVVAEANGWRYGLYRRFGRAQSFYLVIAVAIVGGRALNFVQAFSPVKALSYSAVLNGVFAPPLIIILMLVSNNRKVLGDHCNEWLSNILGGLTVVLMGASVCFLIWSLTTGKAT